MTHRRIATAHSPDQIALCTEIADLVEVRLDSQWSGPPTEQAATQLLADCIEAGEEAGLPLLATLRPKRQGGLFEGPEPVRISLLVAAARAGFAYVDIEADHLDMGPIVQSFKGTADLIFSDHRAVEAPTREQGMHRLQALQDLPGVLDKVAFPAGSFMDHLRGLELAHQHRARRGNPCVAAIGADAAMRALAALTGNQATYGHAPGAKPAVAGQPGLADIHKVWDHWGLGPQELGCAGWYAVLGDPVAHSLSPRMHNAMLRRDGVVQRFGAMRVPDSIGAFRLLSVAAPRIGLLGASVTAPLKKHAAKVCQPDEVVRATGAANCLRWQDGTVQGTNTDGTALMRLLQGADHVAILGAGGAARAAVWAAGQVGADCTVISRQETDLARWAAWGTKVAADVVVQATPLGGRPEDPVPVIDVKTCDHLIELVYADGSTPLQGQVKGRVTSGRDFLLEQGLDAYRFMAGREPDRGVMGDALV